MRQIICTYRTDEELVSSLGLAFIAISFLNFRRSFIRGKQYLSSSASWAMATRSWPSQPFFSAIYDTNKDQRSGRVCVCKVTIKRVVKQISFAYHPFLSLTPCDWSQETASSVMHKFAAIIHYCVRRTRSRF